MSCNDHGIDTTVNPLEEKKEAAGNSHSPVAMKHPNVSMVFARRMISGKWIANTRGGKG